MTGLFDILGPRMVGPSSSHTAGACRLGYVVQSIVGGSPDTAVIGLHGSFAMTGEGHGTQVAILGGLLGFRPDDPRIRDSQALSQSAGLEARFEIIDLGEQAHPNTARFDVVRGDDRVEITGCSIGGGRIRVQQIDGFEVDLSGSLPTIVIVGDDVPGTVAEITGMIAGHDLNLATIRVDRTGRGEKALMTIETDRGCSSARTRRVDGETLGPLDPQRAQVERLMFRSIADWFAAAEESAVNLPTAVLNREAKESGRSAEAIRSRIADAIEVMRGAVSEGLESTATSPSGLTGGRARRLADTGPGLLGARFTDMLARAIATLEVNARMGLIMAAPTAGAAGVLPAVLLTLADERGWSDERLIDAMLVAGGVGAVIAE